MDITAFLMTKAGSIAFFAALGTCIVLLLRFLYGPKGIFRDPAWDEWNDKEQLISGAMPTWYALHEAQFIEYARPYLQQNAHIASHLQLKIDHTHRVVKNAAQLAAHEQDFAVKGLAKALLLSALYHDIGRFEQFSQYQTFADAKSCNHGFLSCKILKKHGFLAKEPPYIRHLVYTAVCLHNRFRVSKNLPVEYKCVLSGVRDADKLDILFIMQEHLGPGKIPDDAVIMHTKEIPGAYSPAVFEALCQNRPASFLDMASANDFRLLLCTWLPELYYATSRRILQKNGAIGHIIAGMQGIDAIRKIAKEKTDSFLQQGNPA